MTAYRYSAIDKDGNTVKGTIQADTPKLARSQLRSQGLLPEAIMAVQQGKKWTLARASEGDCKIPTAQLVLFNQELSALLKAGLEIEESIKSVSDASEYPKFKHIILQVHQKVLEGYSLSQSLNEYPKAFPALYRATVQAGEEAGQLGVVLENLSYYLEKQQEIRQKIKQALVYPIILTLVSISIVIFLLTTVVPKIVSIFAESDYALPLSTRILIATSDFIVDYGWLLAIIILIAGIVMRQLMRIPVYRSGYERFVLKIPFFGKSIRLIQTSRFLRSFGILLQSRVPILESIRVASQLVNILPIKEKLNKAQQQVKEGMSLHLALKYTNYFSPISLQFVANGERSGKIAEMLMHAAEHQEKQVQLSLNILLTLFEPILILLMGSLVLFIVLAILLPMFDMSKLIV